MKHLMMVAALSLMTLAATACNTFEGMGKDISKAGDALSDSAEKTKEKMR